MKNRAIFLYFFLFVGGLYGGGRLYFYLTDGFSIDNIHAEFTSRPQWEAKSLTLEEEKKSLEALSQPYRYLGKGCQSYVFASEDGKFVIKFFKYQHYRLPAWLTYLPPLPACKKFLEEKKSAKEEKWDTFAQGWRVAFDHLRKETGLTYLHLNKTTHLNRRLELIDPMGTRHEVNLDEMQFCLQKRGVPLDQALLELKKNGDFESASRLIDQLLAMLVGEYERGFADNDHAIVQNTGVVDGLPFHMDVGQFVYNDVVKETLFFHQELYTKCYRLHLWLEANYYELTPFLVRRLKERIGPSYDALKPNFKPQEERIKHLPMEEK